MSNHDMVTAVAVVIKGYKLEEQSDVDAHEKRLARLEKLCQAVIGSRSGTSTKLPAAVGLGDAFELTVPVDQAEGLRELLDRAHDETNLDIVVGVGHDIHEAKVAAEQALDDGDELKVYHPDMDDKFEESSKDSHLPQEEPQPDNMRQPPMNKSEDDLKKSDPIVQ